MFLLQIEISIFYNIFLGGSWLGYLFSFSESVFFLWALLAFLAWLTLFYTGVERPIITTSSLLQVMLLTIGMISLHSSFSLSFLFCFPRNLLLENTLTLSPYERSLPQLDHAMARVNRCGSLCRVVKGTLWRFCCYDSDLDFELLAHKWYRCFFGFSDLLKLLGAFFVVFF